MLGPSPSGGKVKVMVRPKIDGYDCRILSLRAVRTTSASTRNVTVSLQARTVPWILRPPCENPSDSIRVNGHGPATQEILAF
jgi:hypothetical protein